MEEFPLKIFCFSGQCARDETCTDSSNVRQILQDLELTLEEMIERENTDIEYWKEVKLDTKKKDYWKSIVISKENKNLVTQSWRFITFIIVTLT